MAEKNQLIICGLPPVKDTAHKVLMVILQRTLWHNKLGEYIPREIYHEGFYDGSYTIPPLEENDAYISRALLHLESIGLIQRINKGMKRHSWVAVSFKMLDSLIKRKEELVNMYKESHIRKKEDFYIMERTDFSE